MRLGGTAPIAEKPAVAGGAEKASAPLADKPVAAAADKPAAAAADKPAAPAAAEKLAADKLADKPAPTPRGAPPERRRALEDSVVTSAPKLAGEPGKAPPARAAAVKAAAKTAPAKPTAAGAADKAAAGDKPAADKPAGMLEPASANVPGPLRPRRDHSKSPGFYSSVSPAHGAHAVSAGPFAASQQKKTVVGVAPPPAEPGKPEEPAKLDGTPGAAATTPEAGAADLSSAAKTGVWLEPPPGPSPEASPGALEDVAAPAQPVSSPPSVSPVARLEKEETSPGLGHARSRHDPRAVQQISSTDLELLLAFALDLALGCASDAWFVPLRAAVGRLLAGDAAMGNPALEKALTTLANDLEQPGAFNEENRQRLYGHVVAVDLALAKRMDVTGQKAIRERLIVDQLLDELSQANPVISRQLKDQGPLSLETLGRLSPEDLSAKLEAPADAAAQVASIFQGYLEARVRRGPSIALVGRSVALRERLSALEASAEAFERASEGEDSGARRQTRKQRQIDVAQLNLLLAELGEAKTLAEIERCSVQAKIERIQRWIGEQEVSSGRQAKPSSPP